MTPTLIGRFQTRVFLSIIIALPILFVFKSIPIIFIMLPLGLLWEFIYDYIQHRRWDADWPLAFTFVGGVLEGGVLYKALSLTSGVPLYNFFFMYMIIFLASFILLAGVLNTLFPYRRFKGGRVL